MKVFITGIAGFIGYHTALRYQEEGWEVSGIDNFNDYYDPQLKYMRQDRLEEKNIDVKDMDIRSAELPYFLNDIKPDLVIHLAASAGVRYSMDNAIEYIDNNIHGTQCVINACEKTNIQNVIYASTSCVMHDNPLPWNEYEKLGPQLSPYGYSKATNEHQFNISKIPNAVCLRFFTVYGPWGRPDMALFTFTKQMLADETITVYNNGDMKRDFTYIDDIVQGIYLVSQNMKPRDTYCLGNGTQVPLMEFITEIERNLGNGESKKDFQPRHPADAKETWSDTTKIQQLGYSANTPISVGVKNFIDWYMEYYN